MTIYPAIDMLGGKCVRLKQGDYNESTVYNDSPAQAAKMWASKGAEWIHLVDLDGAKEKKPVNIEAIKEVRAAVDCKLELGGGIRCEEDIKMLSFSEIECITVLEGKTYAIDSQNRRYRLKQRLYELEAMLPASFIRINKSALANKNALDRFAVTIAGSVDAVFQSGYREYVSRRCFAQIKRRLETK